MLQPREGSLFAILSRSPWWVSLLIAGALFAIVRQFLPDLLAATTTLPFIGLAAYAGWLQAREPSTQRISATLDQLREMRWPEFSKVISDSFRRDGYEVAPSRHVAADLEVSKSGYVTLLSGKRWKVAQVGIAPLRELADAVRKIDAREGCFVTTGALSEGALEFAAANRIRVLRGPELVKQIGRIKAG
jgi:restriction system protein